MLSDEQKAELQLLATRLTSAVNEAVKSKANLYGSIIGSLQPFAPESKPPTEVAPSIAVGDRVPTSTLQFKHDFSPPTAIELGFYTSNRRTLLLGLPGAFTGC